MAEQQVVEQVVEQVVDVDSMLEQLTMSVSTVGSAVKTMQTTLKTLRKEVQKMKKMQRKPKRKSTGTAKPSGFAKPVQLSEELYEFLSVESGVKMPRTEVTKLITKYVKEHDLQNPEDKRQIFPDDKLRKILNVTVDQKVTFFNIQTFMKHHFVKDVPVAAAVQTS